MGRADDGCKAGSCNLCDDPPVLRCSGHSTVGLLNHLLKIHKEEHDKLKLKKDDVKIKKVVRQPTIQILLAPKAPYGPRRPKQKEFDKNVKQQFVNDFENYFVSSKEDSGNEEQGSDDVGSDDSEVQEMEEASDSGEMEDEISEKEEENSDKGGKEYEDEFREELE